MSYAPAAIKEAQVYLKGITGLPWASLGIVADGYGDSYHRGDDRLGKDRSYSVNESKRDQAGLSNAASALDIGDFSVTHNGRRVSLRSLSLWLVEQCKAGAADTKDIRSIIYTPDGKVVRRWDRLGVRSSGDDSHLSHTHISFFRDSEARSKLPLFKRYFEGDDDVTAKDVWQTDGLVGSPRVDGLGRPIDNSGNPHWWPANLLRNHFELTATARGEQLAQHEALMAALKAHSDMPDADFEQIKAAAKAGAEEALASAEIAVTWGPRGE